MLPVLIPLFTTLTRILSAVFVRAVTDLAVAFAFLIKALPPSVLQAIAYGVLAIWAAVKVGGLVMAVSSPLGLLITATALLVVGITELATHWHQVWTAVRNAAADAWRFLTHGWGQYLIPGLTLIRAGVDLVRDHWRQAWRDMANWAATAWRAIHNDVIAPAERFFGHDLEAWLDQARGAVHRWWSDTANTFSSGYHTVYSNTLAPFIRFFTDTLPATFRQAVASIGQWWTGIEARLHGPVAWVVNHVLNGLIGAFDWVTSHIGLGNPIHKITGWAAGGRVSQGTSPTADDVLARVSRDETIVSAAHSRVLAPLFAALGVPGYGRGGRVLGGPAARLLAGLGVPGFQTGGRVGQHAPPVNLHTGVATAGPTGGPDIVGAVRHAAGVVLHKALDIGKITAALLSGNTAALTNAFSDFLGMRAPGAAAEMAAILARVPRALVRDIVGWLMGHGGGASGNAIADYAASFIGRIPYVWGGTQVPGGADCSGFVQAVLGHFGIQAPRTSEEQGAWVRRTGPVPGALALYHSPPGGPDPGHVAIVRNAAQVISQGGGMGPQLMGLHAMPLLWTGVPPHGFGTAAGGANAGTLSAGQIARLWTAVGGPAAAAANMARIAYAESGDRPGAVQKGQPPGLTGWGLYQITPTSGIWQNGAFGNLLNAANNTRAALSLFRASGYQPWAADPVGSSLTRSGLGYAKGGWINEPVTGIGAYSRALYRFGEAGRELVVPEDQAGGGGWGLLAARLDRVIGLLDAGPARTAAGIAAAGAGPARLAAHSAWLAAR
jgi:cell wall-associated NlpC family hydrolase